MKIKYFGEIVILSQDTKILEFSQYRKSDKTRFIIYADLESFIVKTDACKNNLKNYLQQK